MGDRKQEFEVEEFGENEERGEALMGAGEGDWPKETIGVKRLHGRSLFV